MFPAFRRLDAHNWNKLMFYPGAITLLPIRAILALGSFAFCCLLLQPVMIGYDPKVPLTGIREWLRQKIFKTCIGMIPLMAFMSLDYQFVEEDYSYYLGKDYKKTQQLPKKASTVVANHQAWIDNMIINLSPLMPGFAAKIET